MEVHDKIIFPVTPEEEFFGRQEVIEDICRLVREPNKGLSSSNIYLSGRPKTGKTEILSRIYNHLFWEQHKTIPIFYTFPEKSLSIYDLYKDYLSEFLKQYVGFLKKDPALIKGGTSLLSLNRLIKEGCNPQIASLIDNLYEHITDKNLSGVLKTAFSAPSFVASIENARVFVAIDDFHNTVRLTPVEQEGIFQEIEKALKNPSLLHILAGYHSSQLKGFFERSLISPIRFIELRGLSIRESEDIKNTLYINYPIGLNKTEISLIMQELSFNPFYLKIVLNGAKRRNLRLDNLKSFYSIYIDELTTGGLNLFFSSIIGTIPAALRKAAILLLKACCDAKHTDIRMIESSLPCNSFEVKSLIERLSLKGIIEDDFTGLKKIEDPVLKDFVDLLYRTEIKGEDPDNIKGVWIWKRLKGVETKPAIAHHEHILKECKTALEGFLCQRIPRILFEYKPFITRFKDIEYFEISEELKNSKDLYRLPEIVGSSWEKTSNKSFDVKNLILGYGFEDGVYKEGKEVVWLVGCLIFSPEATLSEVSEFMEKTRAIEGNFRDKKIFRWAIAKEGFCKDAIGLLHKEGILISNLTQLYLIRDIVLEMKIEKEKKEAALYEFELVLPMASETELVAARAIEEIAKRGKFDENSINQIKMALIEACINAFEYSRTKESKVYLKFILGEDKLTIYIDNEGRDFDPYLLSEPHIDDKVFGTYKRGWGIKLMRNLMDEVSFERVNNYTRLKMVKYLSADRQV